MSNEKGFRIEHSNTREGPDGEIQTIEGGYYRFVCLNCPHKGNWLAQKFRVKAMGTRHQNQRKHGK